MPEFGELHADLVPVMSLMVEGEWLAVRVDQMERVALAAKLWPVPMTHTGYLGLYDSGERLLPVMSLGMPPSWEERCAGDAHQERLLAILRMRGDLVGLVIDRAGRMHERYWLDSSEAEPPPCFRGLGARLSRTPDQAFWLVDTDGLWQENE